MTLNNGTFEEDKDFNVFQIIALNVVSTLALLSAGLALGTTWWVAMLVAWIAGGMVTFFVAATVSIYRMQAADRQALAQEVFGQASVPGAVTDPLKLWEADRLIDMAQSVSAVSEAETWDVPYKSRSAEHGSENNTDPGVEKIYRSRRANR